MTIREFYADRIIDFLKKYGPHVFKTVDKATVRKHILLHLQYETLVAIWNKGELLAVCAFNVDGSSAKIVECVIKPDYRSRGLLKKMTLVALERYPYITNITFERPLKGHKEPHTIELSKWLYKGVSV